MERDNFFERMVIMKILEELWYGNVNPNERKLPTNSEQYELVKLIVRHEETLFPMLSEQAKEIYEKLRECRLELSSIVECEAFISGFRLATRIMIETIGEDNDE